MITTLDKALAALIMSLVFLINRFTNFHFSTDEQTVSAIVSLLTPMLVYLVPNRQPPPPAVAVNAAS